jgi:hypothetical protein
VLKFLDEEAHRASYTVGMKAAFPEGKAASEILAIHHHLALILRIGGAVSLLPLRALEPCTGIP